MIPIKPLHMILLSALMQVTGCLLPFLMVIHVVGSTFFLNFLSWGFSVSGLFLGIIGVANYVKFGERK